MAHKGRVDRRQTTGNDLQDLLQDRDRPQVRGRLVAGVQDRGKVRGQDQDRARRQVRDEALGRDQDQVEAVDSTEFDRRQITTRSSARSATSSCSWCQSSFW